jgi:hypothetical protein
MMFKKIDLNYLANTAQNKLSYSNIRIVFHDPFETSQEFILG